MKVGRIVIPSEYRRILNVSAGDYLSIHLEGKKVVMVPSAVECQSCSNTDDLITISDFTLCSECFKKIKRYFD